MTLTIALMACGGDDAPSGERPVARSYVAVGDSMSAGGGAPPYDLEAGACLRSPEAWPRALDSALADVGLTALTACGGATVADVVGGGELGLGPQIVDAPDREVDLVTLTIGANDVGYGALLLLCESGCSEVTPEAKATFRATLAALQRSLVEELYPALRTAYPEAEIVHVGYPRLVTTRTPVECRWLQPDEQPILEEVLVDLNGAIEAAVDQLADDRVRYVDVLDVLEGHELCSVAPWVAPLEAGADGGHPTAEGHQAIAEAVAAHLDAR